MNSRSLPSNGGPEGISPYQRRLIVSLAVQVMNAMELISSGDSRTTSISRGEDEVWVRSGASTNDIELAEAAGCHLSSSGRAWRLTKPRTRLFS